MVKAVVVQLYCACRLPPSVATTRTNILHIVLTRKQNHFSISAFGFDWVTSSSGLFSGPFHWREGSCGQLQKRRGLAKPAICVEFSVHWRPCVRATFKNDHSAAPWSGTVFFPMSQCYSGSLQRSSLQILYTLLTPPFPHVLLFQVYEELNDVFLHSRG